VGGQFAFAPPPVREGQFELDYNLGQNVNGKGLYDLHRSAYTSSLRIESLTYILSWKADGSLTWS
jgi:hypothetical protein